MGSNITCALICKQETTAELYTVETLFVPGVIVVPCTKVTTDNNNTKNYAGRCAHASKSSNGEVPDVYDGK